MNAIILASGPGSRMQPWTNTKNKCMFKVDGKPLLIYHIENLINVGVKEIIITIHWQAEELITAISKWMEFLPNTGYTIKYFIEKKLCGSATAVSEIMKKYNLDRTIVIYGDTWFDSVFYNYFYSAYNAYTTNQIFVKPVDEFTNGLVYYDPVTNKVISIIEKYNSSEIVYLPGTVKGINTGALILNKLDGNGDLMNDVLPKIKLYVWEHSCKWVDIGQIDRYIRLILEQYDSIAVQSLIKNLPERFIEFAKKILLAERIFIAGNGGSLSTAQHLALDWSKVGGKNAIALGEASLLSAYANDEGYENVFIKQLKCFNITEQDVIVLISGSGNSKNIVKVLETYPNNTIGMSGQRGYLIANCKLTLLVQSLNIRVIEDIHLAYGHAITEIMEGLA